MTLVHKGIILLVIGLVMGHFFDTIKYDGLTLIMRLMMVLGVLLAIYGLIKKI